MAQQITNLRTIDSPLNEDTQDDTGGLAPIPNSETVQPASVLGTDSTDVTHSHSNGHSSNDSTGQGSEHNVASWEKKFFLTLDGGGVRGYSSLLIIQELMKLCRTCEQRDDSAFLPVHYFDYIAGTSTGGLIAIMLGRLRMTIDDCIEEYKKMGAAIFGKPRIFLMRGPILWNQEKYDHRKLETAIKDVIKRRHSKADQVGDSMYPSNPDRCRTIVVAVRENNSATQPYLFRTYEHPRSEYDNPLELNPGLPTPVPIWKVARATTAAPSYFKPLIIDDEKFLDGGFGTANNPTWHALWEVSQMSANNPQAVALIVSIGTGKADIVHPVAKRGAGLWGNWKAIIRYSAATTTDSEATHIKVDQISRQTGRHYERFNVDGGLGSVDLGEWKVKHRRNLTLEKIQQQTRVYLDQPDIQTRLMRVAEELVRMRQERSKTTKWEIVATGRRYRCVVDQCPAEIFTREEGLKIHLVRFHSTLGYVWPANTNDEITNMKRALQQGTILHAD